MRTRVTTALVVLALGSAVTGLAEAETLSGRRKALFGTEIPVISIVSDSIGIGVQMGPRGRARDTFVKRLFDVGFVVHLNGRGISQAADLHEQYATAVAADNFLWRIALVMQGTNDFALDRPMAEVSDGYEGFLDEVMASPIYGAQGQALVCVTPLQRVDEELANGAGYSLRDLRAEIRRVCAARSLPVWEGTDLLPADELSASRPSGYFQDGIHPNRRGQRMLGRSIADRILRYYEQLPAASIRRELLQ